MKELDRSKRIFILLSTYIVLLTMPKIKQNETKVIFNNDYEIENSSPFATYNNHNIYIGNKSYIERIKNDNSTDIYIIDDRNNKDPNMEICDSFKINNRKEMISILKVILEYENTYPSNWNRSQETMLREWLFHNLCHLLKIKINNAEHVDLNNMDEKTYTSYVNIITEIYNELYQENIANNKNVKSRYIK